MQHVKGKEQEIVRVIFVATKLDKFIIAEVAFVALSEGNGLINDGGEAGGRWRGTYTAWSAMTTDITMFVYRKKKRIIE